MLLLNVSAPKHLSNLFTSYRCHLLPWRQWYNSTV